MDGLEVEIADPAVVVCAELLERLGSPEPVLRFLQRLTRTHHAVVLTTPDRRRTNGPLHGGPPVHPHHVREWTLEEFTTLAFEYGFTLAFAGLMASDDADYAMKTCVLVAVNPTQSAEDRMRTGEFCRQTLQGLQDGVRRPSARSATRA
jgi:hypothetical protein